MPSLAHYVAQYDHEHESAWNKVLHGVGIPMIFPGVILLILMKWLLGQRFLLADGVPVSRPPDRREPSGVFPGTDLFVSWVDLGR